MKKYKVQGWSNSMEVDINCASAEQANDLYEMMMDSGEYYKGQISSNETGELFCYFYREKDACGMKFVEWVAD